MIFVAIIILNIEAVLSYESSRLIIVVIPRISTAHVIK